MHSKYEYDKNYATVISKFAPTKRIHVEGDPSKYSAIVWMDNEPIPQSVLDGYFLEYIKQLKVDDLNEACEISILAGLVSNCLGSDHWYDMEEVDQLNAIGAVVATLPTAENPNGTNTLYACKDVVTRVKEYKVHTHAQMRRLVADGATHKLTLLELVLNKRTRVWQCTTVADVLNINW